MGIGSASRRVIELTGVVQGVGLRPTVFELASRLGLHGFVRNELGTVHIEVEGTDGVLDEFARTLPDALPPLAKLHSLRSHPMQPLGVTGFTIEASDGTSAVEISLPPDVATCDACLRELFDPADRRFGYPFINCTHCGPRYTLIRDLPYDRPTTTMAGFPLCDACRTEYENPRDRRFHAQPIACPVCGPCVRVVDLTGRSLEGDAIETVARALGEGKIVAVKGLGGFHLACDATDSGAIERLRQRKHRDAKPLAVMVEDLAAAEHWAHLTGEDRALLCTPARPIVLLPARVEAPLAPGVAPGGAALGLMLPYTPLHHLLLRAVKRPLVMTSGNLSDDPIAFRDGPAREKLGDIADLFMLHDRPIHAPADDSVVRAFPGGAIPVRRSRGYAPSPMWLPWELSQPTLALGGQLKSTFAIGADTRVVVSHHLGDLDHVEAYLGFERAIAHYQKLHRIRPTRLVHDLHPDYGSTRYAIERAANEGLAILGVQHHHAHFASCLAEHAFEGRALGLSLDGAGHGLDGTVWGGELLLGEAARSERVGHLREVALPGGDRAAREPWRMALVHLRDAGLELDTLASRLDGTRVTQLDQLLASNATVRTTSAGRLFDAVAWLLGGPDVVRFEGQAALWLEGLAVGDARELAHGLHTFDDSGALDLRPLIRAIVADTARVENAHVWAWRFHHTIATGLAELCERARTHERVDTVALSGGCFVNAVLTRTVTAALAQRGFHALRHRVVPPNDGGLSLGQIATIAASDSKRKA